MNFFVGGLMPYTSYIVLVHLSIINITACKVVFSLWVDPRVKSP